MTTCNHEKWHMVGYAVPPTDYSEGSWTIWCTTCGALNVGVPLGPADEDGKHGGVVDPEKWQQPRQR